MARTVQPQRNYRNLVLLPADHGYWLVALFFRKLSTSKIRKVQSTNRSNEILHICSLLYCRLMLHADMHGWMQPDQVTSPSWRTFRSSFVRFGLLATWEIRFVTGYDQIFMVSDKHCAAHWLWCDLIWKLMSALIWWVSLACPKTTHFEICHRTSHLQCIKRLGSLRKRYGLPGGCYQVLSV